MTEKRDLLTIESLTELASMQRPPCLSLYQPTHRRRPENQQDPIRFRNLVKELEKSLRQSYPEVAVRLALEPFEKLAHESDFWKHTLDGLAVLAGSGVFRVFRLQRPVAELAIVADTFHTKPLRRFLQSADRFQVLGLSLGKVRLFEGNRDALDEIAPLPGVPLSMTDVLGDEAIESHMTVASYGGAGQGSSPMHHGDGGKQDASEVQAERYFRAVDRAVIEQYSEPSGLPLILAALPEHHHLFRRVSHNSLLRAEGISVNPATIPIDELRNRAWQVVEPQYLSGLATLAADFAASKAKGLGADDLVEVAQAAAAGRVGTLLIESDRHIAGGLESSTGRIDFVSYARR